MANSESILVCKNLEYCNILPEFQHGSCSNIMAVADEPKIEYFQEPPTTDEQMKA